ncbi:ROK family protein [Mahella australiensis]|jgi:glucokinase|uniref:ROK family protein n=1 Tax=Mahella australiensis (strain DSM 15567 / CIP 107919 / 50-1 BON) TaxID=697281 RepID=F4A259_MAHA5|nr:ROK family protein [Mahella australiensis]AEE97198.1 ROK family protein [Mahella australiensis 50-1 BON]
MGRYFIGLDIGGTKLAAILGTSDGRILKKLKLPSEADKGPEQMLDKLTAMAQQLMGPEVVAIGISCGGPLDSRKGIIMSPPNLPGWDNVHIVDIMSRRFGVPAYLQNDANACALAEHRFGAGVGCDNMVFLTFGTGMGAGLILNGRLYSGITDTAGEVGHIRLAPDGPVGYGKAGSFEGFCSGGGIAKLAAQMIKDSIKNGKTVAFCPTVEQADSITAEDVGKAAAVGDPLATEILKISGKYLGYGLSIIIDILNPERIIIGSIFARCRDILQPEAEKVIKEEALPIAARRCSIMTPGLGEAIGDYASLSIAIENWRENVV